MHDAATVHEHAHIALALPETASLPAADPQTAEGGETTVSEIPEIPEIQNFQNLNTNTNFIKQLYSNTFAT